MRSAAEATSRVTPPRTAMPSASRPSCQRSVDAISGRDDRRGSQDGVDTGLQHEAGDDRDRPRERCAVEREAVRVVDPEGVPQRGHGLARRHGRPVAGMQEHTGTLGAFAPRARERLGPALCKTNALVRIEPVLIDRLNARAPRADRDQNELARLRLHSEHGRTDGDRPDRVTATARLALDELGREEVDASGDDPPDRPRIVEAQRRARGELSDGPGEPETVAISPPSRAPRRGRRQP